MTELFLKIYDRLSSSRIIAWVILGVVIVSSAILISGMHYSEDISSFLPENEISRKYSDIYRQLGGQDKIVVLFSLRDSCSSEDSTSLITEAMDVFEGIWRDTDTSGIVTDMQVKADYRQILEVTEFIRDNIPYFLDAGDYERMDSLLSIPGYTEIRLQKVKESLMSPISGPAGEALRYDPLDLFSPVYQKLGNLNAGHGVEIIDGHFFICKGRRGVIFFTSPFGESESGMNSSLTGMIDNVIQKTEIECGNIMITATGGPLVAVSNADRIKADSVLAVSIAVVLIIVVLLLSFRNFGDIFWIGFSTFCGTVFAIGLVALFKDSISIIILGIGSMIIGIAVNYPLHFIDHLKHQPDNRAALKDMVSPLLTGNITTVCAFLSLMLLSAEALRDFGLVSALVLVGTVIFILVFLPVLMKSGKVRREKVIDMNLDRLVPSRLRSRMSVPFVIITVVLAFFSFRVGFDSDIRNINYMTDSQREDLALLASVQASGNGSETVYAVSEAQDTGSALLANERLLSSLERTVDADDIISISRLIPSREEQGRRLEMWDSFREKYQYVVQDLSVKAKTAGFSADAFSPFMENIWTGYAIRESGFFNPLFKSVGKSSVFECVDGTAIVNCIDIPERDVSRVKEKLRHEAGTGALVFDSSDVGNQLVELLSDDFDAIGYICGIIVFFFLWVSFGRIELSLLAFLPLAVGWVWILGIMGIAGLQFNIVNIVLATFIFGQGDDYTIFITDGLMYEYTYGKKILSSYKNSVALSAIIMFIGIGSLIFARHPAMKSLAEVTMIGMTSVVLMAYYLPPLVFRMLTEKNGMRREVPITLKRICYSIFSFAVFLLIIAIAVPCTRLYFIRPSARKREKYHIFLQKLSRFVATHIPGVGYRFRNTSGERFEKPAVIICNHQSHLDVMYLLMLSPKMVILTNDWVWNNPFYKWIIRNAEFYPVSEGFESCLPKMKDLMERGYSIVVFPEGTRSEDCSIGRFHRGAFYLAEQLGADILPIFIHGVGHVLPKKELMLREGRVYVEIGSRIRPDDSCWGVGFKERTRMACSRYRTHFNEICIEQEDTGYNLRHVKYRYLYKTYKVRRSVSRDLSRRNIEIARGLPAGSKTIGIAGSGAGAFAMLVAMSNKDSQVYAWENDEELMLAGKMCYGIPDNLHFISTARPDIEITINMNEI